MEATSTLELINEAAFNLQVTTVLIVLIVCITTIVFLIAAHD